MFLACFPSGLWQANCWIVAAEDAGECVVIDPGQDSVPVLERLLAEHRLTPVGVLATHGHFDHIAGAAEFADAHSIGVWIHPADRHLLSDPAAGLSVDGVALLRQVLGGDLREPAVVESLAVASVSLAGLEFSVRHAPGHTAGSVLLGLPHPERPGAEVVFCGDVVFAGSIGRTDLPGGDPEVMATTLANVVLELGNDTVLLPGHGPQTTMAAERAGNPYLRPGQGRI